MQPTIQVQLINDIETGEPCIQVCCYDRPDREDGVMMQCPMTDLMDAIKYAKQAASVLKIHYDRRIPNLLD